jgi:hypothetical protein
MMAFTLPHHDSRLRLLSLAFASSAVNLPSVSDSEVAAHKQTDHTCW